MKHLHLVAALAIGPLGAAASPRVVFDFDDGTAFDGTGIGAAMTVSNLTITTVDIVGQDGSKSSDGANHKTNIFGNWNALGINDANASGNEYGSFDSGEAWIFTFDADVFLSVLDCADLGDPNLPFIAGMLEQDDRDGEAPRALNDVILHLPSTVTNTAVASSDELTTLDGTHFDSASQRLFGLRYADALLSLE